jgi:hypothetical protein
MAEKPANQRRPKNQPISDVRQKFVFWKEKYFENGMAEF